VQDGFRLKQKPPEIKGSEKLSSCWLGRLRVQALQDHRWDSGEWKPICGKGLSESEAVEMNRLRESDWKEEGMVNLSGEV